MRTIIPVFLLLTLYGCQSESRQDPYLEAINQYNISLAAAKAHGTQIDPPPKPAYLDCIGQAGPSAEAPETELGPTNESLYGADRIPEFSTMSQGECERTNTARKDAYEDAMQRYEKIVAGRSTAQH